MIEEFIQMVMGKEWNYLQKEKEEGLVNTNKAKDQLLIVNWESVNKKQEIIQNIQKPKNKSILLSMKK